VTDDRELNRALLARQGLLERIDAPLAEAVERIGAVQAQSWPAVPVALWSRVQGFTPDALYAALEDGSLVTGIVHRGTIHVVSAREYPVYAAMRDTTPWRTKAEPSAEAAKLQEAIRTAAEGKLLSSADVAEAAEAWVAKHPGAIAPEELEHQRKHRWRTLLRSGDLLRVPSTGAWGPKAPDAVTAAPAKAPAGEALDAVVRAHLRAFGPAGAEDVASWIGWNVGPVREALARAEGVMELEGRLYDLQDGPRPGADVPAPVRFLAAFDSVILAYAPTRRARLIPEGRFEQIYNRGNLQIRPTVLVDGLVAGTWSVQVKGRRAALEIRPFGRLPRGAKDALLAEADALLAGVHPSVTNRSAAIA
jgi:hypothetical protein